jgi:hypothetical protein
MYQNTQTKTARAFVAGTISSANSTMTDGDTFWSYQTAIAARTRGDDGRFLFVVNVTKYSVTTSKYQSYVRGEIASKTGCDVVTVDNMPKGCTRADLFRAAGIPDKGV